MSSAAPQRNNAAPLSLATGRLERVAPSATLAITAKAAELRQAGVDVLSFSAGEPDFATPAHIVEAANRALAEEATHHYPPVAGIRPLREAVARHVGAKLGQDVAPQQVVVTVGAKQALYEAFAVLLDEGDEALVLSPYWISYPEQIRLNGATPVFVETAESARFQPTLEALRKATTPRTKALVYSSPSNPTGSVFDDEHLEQIATWARETGCYVISDEIYEELAYERPHRSLLQVAPDLHDRVIYVSGLSKSYAMTGWRLGYLVAPEPVSNAVQTVQSHINTNTATFVQQAALAALNGDQAPLAEMKAAFRRRRDLMVAELAAMPRISLVPPDGAFYCLPNVSQWFGAKLGGVTVQTASDFAQVCLEQAHVALVPGEGFGAPQHVRFSFACGEAQIREGMRRLRELLTAANG